MTNQPKSRHCPRPLAAQTAIYRVKNTEEHMLLRIYTNEILALHGTGHTGDELLLHQEEDGSSGDGCQNDGAHHHTVVRGIGCAHSGQDQG